MKIEAKFNEESSITFEDDFCRDCKEPLEMTDTLTLEFSKDGPRIVHAYCQMTRMGT
jgi:hypothetical protein